MDELDTFRGERTRCLQGAIDQAARQTQMDEQTTRTLKEAAGAFVERIRVRFEDDVPDPDRQFVSMQPLSGPHFHVSFEGTTMPTDVARQLGIRLCGVVDHHRSALIALLTGHHDAYVSKFGSFLKQVVDWEMDERGLFTDAAEYFGTPSDRIPSLIMAKNEATDAFIASDALRKIATVRAYLQGDWAPVVHESYSRQLEFFRQSQESDLFAALMTNEHYPALIDEMPALLSKSSHAMYRSLRCVLPPTSEGDQLATDADAPDVQQFLHLLCVLLTTTQQYFPCSQQKSDLEVCCIYRIQSSVAKALFMDFLSRRFPGLLRVPSSEDFVAQEECGRSFETIAEMLKTVVRRLRDDSKKPPSASLGRFKVASEDLLHRLEDLVSWLCYMVSTGAAYASSPLTENVHKRPADFPAHLEASSIIKAEIPGGLLYERTSTAGQPNIGYGIRTVYAMYATTAPDPNRPMDSMIAWRHTPNGPAVSDLYDCIGPGGVLGDDHPLTKMTNRVAGWGDELHWQSGDMQRRKHWYLEAQDTGIALRVVEYEDEIRCHGVRFNLFTAEEAARMRAATRVRLTGMAKRHTDVYQAMRTAGYRFPTDRDGQPLPLTELFMEILDEDSWNDGGEEEGSPSSLEDGGRRQQRTTRVSGGVGTGCM